MKNNHVVVDVFDGDDLNAMIDHVVGALHLTNVQRKQPRTFPATVSYNAFTSLTVYGSIGDTRVSVTAFTSNEGAS